MRRILTSIAAAALVFSLVAQASPSHAIVTGYDSAYSGESAFLTLGTGQTGSFTVFFANTGSATWTLGAESQVDLAACREDKITCNSQDSDEAAFDNGWRTSTRYAAHTQTAVAPGQIGTFTYSVRVPSDASAGTYRFNGALVLASTGADIHNEGYYQDVTVEGTAAGAAVLTDIDPSEGTSAGGESVDISGTGIDCSPEPTVLFGSTEAEIESCTSTEVTVETPAHAVGSVNVTLTNSGASPSNSLTFEFTDEARPLFTDATAQGSTVTLEFNEPVCAETGTLTANTEIRVRVNGEDVTETSIDFADCGDDEFSETATLGVSEGLAEGDEVVVTITTTGADEIFDQDDNAMDLGESQTTIAVADETDPEIVSAGATDEQTLQVVYSEPVDCAGTDDNQFVFDPDELGEDDVVAIDVDCDGSRTVSVGFPINTFAAGVTGNLEYNTDDDPIEDLSGNEALDQTIAITPTDQDDPKIDDASITDSAGFQNSADNQDEVTIVFSEEMNSSTSGDIVRVMDDDGTIADIRCTSVATADNDVLDASCDYDGEELVITLLEDAAGEVIADGETTGLQWPAEIIDTANVTDEEGEQVDLDASADTTIE